MSIEWGTVGEWVGAAGTIGLGVAAAWSASIANRVSRRSMRMEHVQVVELGYHSDEFTEELFVTLRNGTPFPIRDVRMEAEGYAPESGPELDAWASLAPGETAQLGVNDAFRYSPEHLISAEFTYADGSRWALTNTVPVRLVSEKPRHRLLRRRGSSRMPDQPAG